MAERVLLFASALALTLPWVTYRVAGLAVLAAMAVVQLRRGRVLAGQPA